MNQELVAAPIAYAPAKSDNHLNTGFMSLLSPVVDTIIVCSMTSYDHNYYWCIRRQ